MTETLAFDWDYAVIGSGFGGSVAALRLAQKGYRVVVVEEGRRWGADDFPRSSWQAKKYLWLPALGCYGLQRMDLLDHLFVVRGAGVGGGSLIYGNTLFTPLPAFFETPVMRTLGGPAAWQPFYELARKMMGVAAGTAASTCPGRRRSPGPAPTPGGRCDGCP